MTLHDRGSFRKNSLISPTAGGSQPQPISPLDQRLWNQSQPTNKALDYLCLLNNLSETVPGSQRKLTKKPSFRAFNSGDYEKTSVLSSATAQPIADHDLKLLQRMKSGEIDDINSYDQYRKSLVIEKKKRNTTFLHNSTSKDASGAAGGSASARSKSKQELIKNGEVLNSPFNPERPGNHIAMMEKLRRVKYGEEQLESFDFSQEEEWEARERDNGEINGSGQSGSIEKEVERDGDSQSHRNNERRGMNWEDSLDDDQEGLFPQEIPLKESQPTDPASELPQLASSQPQQTTSTTATGTATTSRYLVDSHTPSPFLDENGQPLPTKKFTPKLRNLMTPLERDRYRSVLPSKTKRSSSTKTPIAVTDAATGGKETFKKTKKTKKVNKKQESPSPPRLSPHAALKQQQLNSNIFPSSPLHQQKFTNQSNGFKVINHLDDSHDSPQPNQINSTSQTSMEELLLSDVLLFHDSPHDAADPDADADHHHNNSTKKTKLQAKKNKKTTKSFNLIDELSPKFSKEYYELCTLNIQRDSQISWEKIKKREQFLMKSQLAQKRRDREREAEREREEQRQQLEVALEREKKEKEKKEREERANETDEGLQKSGSRPGDGLVEGFGDDDNTSDFTIQEFIGVQITSSSSQPISKVPNQRTETAYEYLLNDTQNYSHDHPLTDETINNSSCHPPAPNSPSPLPSLVPLPATQSSSIATSLRIDRDNLLTATDLDNLSQGQSQSLDSHSDLFSTDGLLNMKISVNDPLILVASSSSPQDMIAKCIGRLLFSEQSPSGGGVQIRPASAGIGGISRPKLYSNVLNSVRPLSGGCTHPIQSMGHTRRREENYFHEKLYSHETKRRNVIERSLPADRWLM